MKRFMANNFESETVGCRISPTFKDALASLAKKYNITASKLGRIAVRRFLNDSNVNLDDDLVEIAKRFPKQYMLKRIISLDIPDVYHYNQPKLIEILKSKIDGLF